jgi:hypothetical protein
MAKTSILAREKKRADTVAKFAVKRAAIKAILKDINASDDDKWAAQIQLQNAARCEPRPPAKPLQNHWAPAWRVPQVRHVPSQAS